MINQKKTAAILLGLTMGVSSSVLAAPAVDTANPDLAARIAAIEAQQQELTKQNTDPVSSLSGVFRRIFFVPGFGFSKH